MSGRHNHQEPSPPRQPQRRIASVYDKLEEARARRAALMKGGQAANLPNAARRASPKPEAALAATRHPLAKVVSEVHEPAAQSVPVPPQTTQAPAREVRSDIRSLVVGSLIVLLAILIGIAYFQMRSAPVPPSPVTSFQPSPLFDAYRPAPFVALYPDTFRPVILPERPQSPPRPKPENLMLVPEWSLLELAPVHISQVERLSPPPFRPLGQREASARDG